MGRVLQTRALQERRTVATSNEETLRRELYAALLNLQSSATLGAREKGIVATRNEETLWRELYAALVNLQ